MDKRPPVTLLFVSIFVIATCGLVYELIAGTVASYLLGDSVTQFSTIIGLYLFSMGVGSFLSRYARDGLIARFVQVELLIGMIGGGSAALLFLAFEHVASFRVLLYGLVSVTGILVGVEIPLLMRILKGRLEFRDLVSQVFTFDYIGALLASLLFPLVLVPHLGLIRSAFLFGLLNVSVALWAIHRFGSELGSVAGLRLAGIFCFAALTAGFAAADSLMSLAENANYPHKVIFAKSSPYQRIVLTREGDDLRLFLNGNLQFSSKDEYRYHEALVHPGLSAVPNPREVLVLGGGDGLAVREILKNPFVKHVTLVDLDPEMTRLFTSHPALVELNRGSLSSPKVTVVHEDAFSWLQKNERRFDFIAVDFPDPSNFSLGKLYSTALYERMSRALALEGVAVVQSTSPYVARKAFSCVLSTLEAAGLHAVPYHAMVPSFGEWGFLLASHVPYRAPDGFPAGLKFIDAPTLRGLLQFPKDMAPLRTEPNRLNNQRLVRYFEEEWAGQGQ